MLQPTARLWVRLAAICIAAAVAPILVGGLLIADRIESSARTRATADLRRTAQIAAGQVQRFAFRASGKLTTLARLLATSVDAAGSDNDRLQRTVLARLEGQVEPPGLFLGLDYIGLHPHSNISVQQIALPEPSEVMLSPPAQAAIGPYNETRFDRVTVALSAAVPGDPEPTGTLRGYLDLRELTDLMRPLASAGVGIEVVDKAGSRMLTVGDWPDPKDAEIVNSPVQDLDWSVEVRGSLAAALATADAARRQVWGVTNLAGAIATALALLMALWIVRPITRLTRAATEMATGNLASRANLRRNDEIGELGAAFDHMAAAVQRLDQVRSDFVGTVSHELRTPLTSLRANLANLADGIHGDLTERQQQAANRIADDIVRLQAIVEETLELSRLEAGTESLTAEPCDLHEIATAAAAERAETSAARGVKITVTGSTTVSGNAALLQRAIGNLLDNALAFAPADSAITAQIEPGTLRVRDQGPGFSIEHPFEPFAQGHTEGRKNPGVGLGLAIVARIVKLHHGEVTAHNDGGAVVTIRLPEAP